MYGVAVFCQRVFDGAVRPIVEDRQPDRNEKFGIVAFSTPAFSVRAELQSLIYAEIRAQYHRPLDGPIPSGRDID